MARFKILSPLERRTAEIKRSYEHKLEEAKRKYGRHCAKCEASLASEKEIGRGRTLIKVKHALERLRPHEDTDWTSDDTEKVAEDDAKKAHFTRTVSTSSSSSCVASEHGEDLSEGEDLENMDISDTEPEASPSTTVTPQTTPDRSQTPATEDTHVARVKKDLSKALNAASEDKDFDEGVEVDIEEEQIEYDDEEDDDYEESDGEDEGTVPSDPSDEDAELGEEDEEFAYLRHMTRPTLERILQRLLQPPHSPQTRRAVQSLIQENIPGTVAAYDTSVRIKVNETFTAMVQEMQEEHTSITSDDFADVMARFLRNEVKVLQSFPGSNKATFELILYIAEHSFGDLDSDDRPGFGERTEFDNAADRALLYVAEKRLEEEGAAFRAAIPGYLETIRSQAMYLYRHDRHPRTWFPASIAFLHGSLQVNSRRKIGRLRSETRTASPFRLQRVEE
ncbi:hypothetical protein BDW22DRAFT_1484981 [Trametopsis cervina]|nr:hypothetical protein BDW22DRAFT_1484981 [Trametopsis cervina]